MRSNLNTDVDTIASDDVFAMWRKITFSPREFFAQSQDKPSRPGPVVFALIVALVAACGGTIVALVFSKGEMTAGAIFGAVFRATLGTLVGVYVSAGVLHVLLRIVGLGRVTVQETPSAAAADSPATNGDERYAPPNAIVSTERKEPATFDATLRAVGYARAPLLFGILDAPGEFVGTIWWAVILVIALSRVHRTSIWRSFGVTFTMLGGPVFLALVVRAGVVEAFKIPSGAMIPSLMIGDHIFVNKFVYGPVLPGSEVRLLPNLPPDRGDVMVFKFPENKNQDFIKRVIALPGDRLEAINGRPLINGWLVPHCHVGRFGKNAGNLYVEFLGNASYLTLYEGDATQPEGPDGPKCTANDDCSLGQECVAGICGHHQGPFQVAPNEVWVMGDNRNNSFDSRAWRQGQGAGVPFENIKGRAMFVWMSFAPGGGVASDRLFVSVMGPPTIPGNPDPALRSALDKCLQERPSPEKTTPPAAKQSLAR